MSIEINPCPQCGDGFASLLGKMNHRCGVGGAVATPANRKTKCTHCGVVTDKQPEGDGCHACSRGTMRDINEYS